MRKRGIPTALGRIIPQITPPTTAYPQYTTAILGYAAEKTCRKSTIVEAMRLHVRAKMTDVVRKWFEERRREKVKAFNRQRLTGKIPTDSLLEEKKRKMKRRALEKFRAMKKEISAFTEYLLEKTVAVNVTTFTGSDGGRVLMVTWRDLNPAFLFAIEDFKKENFWEAVSQRVKKKGNPLLDRPLRRN